MIRKALALSPEITRFSPLFFSGDLDAGIRQAREMGYDGVEISVNDPTRLDWNRIRSSLRDAGMAVATVATGQACVQDGLHLCSSDATIRRRTVDRVKRQLEFAASVGSAHLTLGGIRGKANGPIDGALYGAVCEAVHACGEHAAQCGVGILIEPVNHYEVSLLHTVAQSLDFIRDVDHGALSLLYDTYHANMEESSMIAPLLAAGELLHHVHLADNNRFVPGYGCLDFVEILRTLEQIGYDGYLCIEALPFPDSRTAAAQAMRYLDAILK